ncbi:nucleoside triphosphate pyrophosphohydrolase family protein [Gleimia sp. 6138-11-ORH1]|uniref:nucleoside triphosphate pyrophosphohydrolase family protein n=1 Tax=Gleimia sp. 6138-11-ORH1 TaxID=2973937 RepID=UPI002166DCD4|nr:nucleoside triphosphate pyrophosphohydrolase family protein [Gleimia sp. 6138-11-ORH1]MCS4484280.1 nucleoside triphosphate pyrophosphohydrolase family protein [Gleimia sp. 6138-11-ORH1]
MSEKLTHNSYDPTRPNQLVRQFHEVYNLPVLMGETPTCDRERIHMRMGLISEEFAELTGALYGQTARKIIEKANQEAKAADDQTRDTVEVADALADLVYVIYGMALECGIDLDAVLAEVQASNLSKLGEDGKPIYREDGKVLKGPGFFPPNVAKVLGLED